MSRIKAIQASPDILAAAARPDGFRPTVSIRQLQPSKEDDGTIESARDFLVSQWRLGGLVGIEYQYDGEGKTTFNLISEEHRKSQTLTQFSSHFENARFRANQEPNLCIESDEFVAATEFHLDEDYWYPLLGVADQDYRNLRDPMGNILTAMAENGKSNVRYTLQVLAVPVSDSKWSNRWSIPYVVGGTASDVVRNSTAATGYLVASSLSGLQMIFGGGDGGRIEGATNFFRYMGKSAQSAVQTVLSPLERMVGYTRDDLVNKHGGSAERVEDADESTTQDEIRAERQSEAAQRINEKAESHGFITTIRLVAVGESEQQVESGIGSVASQIQDSFQPTNRASGVSQGLSYKRSRRSKSVKRILSAAMERSDGVDWHNRIEQRESLRLLRRKRKKPTILTPKSLAALLHPPDYNDVADPSISWSSGVSSGTVSPDAPRFDPRTE